MVDNRVTKYRYHQQWWLKSSWQSCWLLIGVFIRLNRARIRDLVNCERAKLGHIANKIMGRASYQILWISM